MVVGDELNSWKSQGGSMVPVEDKNKNSSQIQRFTIMLRFL